MPLIKTLFYCVEQSCKYKIWYVGKCHENGTEIVHLILSKGEINCTVSKQIIQECDYVANKSKVKVPADAPIKEFLEKGNHTIDGVAQMLKNRVSLIFIFVTYLILNL